MMSRPIQKPAWLLFAAEVRVELDNMPIRKSEKPFERRVLDRYREACALKGYQGSLADWEYLLHRLGENRTLGMRHAD